VKFAGTLKLAGNPRWDFGKTSGKKVEVQARRRSAAGAPRSHCEKNQVDKNMNDRRSDRGESWPLVKVH
jgi:hypothetical protein